MNFRHSKLAAWMLALCLALAGGVSSGWAHAQAGTGSATQATPAAPPSGTTTAAPKASAAGKPSASEIAAAKASGKVWVNTDSGVYHKSGRWYGATKAGKFMTEADAKSAGYKPAK